MTEVIEIPSSSPARADRTSAATKATFAEKFTFDLDDLDETESLDFGIGGPSKRARLSPQLEPTSKHRKLNPATETTPAADFDFSSDDDLLVAFERKTTTTHFKGSARRSGEVDTADEIVYSSSAPGPPLPRRKTQKGVETTGESILHHWFSDDLLDDPPISQS